MNDFRYVSLPIVSGQLKTEELLAIQDDASDTGDPLYCLRVSLL